MTIFRARTFLAVLVLFVSPIAVPAFERGVVERFATLPAGERTPRGSAWTARATSMWLPLQRTNPTRAVEH